MRFTPKYTVSYHGVIHTANLPFEIEANDAEEMRMHGAVENTLDSTQIRVNGADGVVHADKTTETQRKPGRPKKKV